MLRNPTCAQAPVQGSSTAAATGAPPSAEANAAVQQQSRRLMDVTAEPLEMLGPIKGVMESDELSLFDAALRTGLDIDSEAFASTEVGTGSACLSMQAGSVSGGDRSVGTAVVCVSLVACDP